MDDLNALAERAEYINSNTITSGTRTSYQRTIVNMLMWFYKNQKEILNENFVRNLNGVQEDELQKQIRTLLEQRIPPLKFELFETQNFKLYLCSLKKKDGSQLGFSAMNLRRAALNSLFQDFEAEVSRKLEAGLKKYFKGLKRVITLERHQSKTSKKTGKDPLPYSMYQEFSNELLVGFRREYTFCKVFVAFCWNLMCRAGSAFAIKLCHLSWREDALTDLFGHMKNDQSGIKGKEPRHLYANPQNPDICPILALALHLNVNGFGEDGDLFCGNDQYDRFRKAFERLKESPRISFSLRERGIDPVNLGTHSLRKGSCTFCTSGVVNGPTIVAVHLRAGWTLPGVTGTYFQHENAGDMHVGRTVSGLSPRTEEFGMLPPHFPVLDEEISRAVDLVFPGHPFSLRSVLNHCLASLVYHSDYLKEVMPTNHSFLQSNLFTKSGLLESLKPKVVCGVSLPGVGLQPTGVTLHTDMMMKQRINYDAIMENRDVIIERLLEKMDERDGGTGLVTVGQLNNTLKKAFKAIGLTQLVQKINDNELTNPLREGREQRSYTWGGKFRKLPEKFTFPSCTVRNLWILWLFGNVEQGIPPYKNLQGSDLPNKNDSKKLSEMRFLLKKLVLEAQRQELNLLEITFEVAMEFYKRQSRLVQIGQITCKKRRRRNEELSWTTVAKEMRKLNKK